MIFMENKDLFEKILKCTEYIDSASRSYTGNYIIVGSQYQKIMENHKKMLDREEKLKRILGK